MMNLKPHFALSITVVAFLLVGGASAIANTITYTITRPSATAIADAPELSDAKVFDFFVSTPAEIFGIILQDLSPGMSGEFYNHPLAIDVGPLPPGIISFLPAAEFDSYLTTPGVGPHALASESPCGSEGGAVTFHLPAFGLRDYCEVGWFSASAAMGPSNDFHFARLTLLGDDFVEMNGYILMPPSAGVGFSLPIAIRGSGQNLEGAVFVPEPSTAQLALFLAIGMLGMARRRCVHASSSGAKE